MKILVTGGAGFIGTNVCLEARNRGHEVVAFDNFVRSLTEENIPILLKAGIKIARGDIRNYVDFAKLPWYPEGIVHLAGQCGIPYAQISPRYDFEINALGTLNILEYARLNGKIPVAFASSNKVYTNLTNDWQMNEIETRYIWHIGFHIGFRYRGMHSYGEIDENLPLDAFGKYARSLYGASKVAGDLYCQEYCQAFGVPTVINRMSCIYGIYQKGTEDQAWVDFFIRQIMLGNGKINIFGTGKQVRDMLWGGDVARLYIDELENIDKVKGKPYNIGGGINNTMSLLEAIAEIEKQTDKKAQLTFMDKRHGDQDIWISDLTKIKQDLGWEPTISPSEGIGKIIEEYKK